MLVKAVLVFLLGMVALAMVGRALGIGPKKRVRIEARALCGRCGRLLAPREACTCGTPPKA